MTVVDARSGLQADGSWVPAFEGQRPPLARGHILSLDSGVFAPRVRSVVARELLAQHIQTRPHMVEAYPEEFAALCRVEARTLLADKWLEDHDQGIGERGEVREVLREWRLLEARASTMRNQLGLTLAGDAEARRNQAVAAVAVTNLAALVESGQRIRAAVENPAAAALEQSASDVPDEWDQENGTSGTYHDESMP